MADLRAEKGFATLSGIGNAGYAPAPAIISTHDRKAAPLLFGGELQPVDRAEELLTGSDAARRIHRPECSIRTLNDRRDADVLMTLHRSHF